MQRRAGKKRHHTDNFRRLLLIGSAESFGAALRADSSSIVLNACKRSDHGSAVSGRAIFRKSELRLCPPSARGRSDE
eukprot:132534-Prymnesium_polylepis.1